MPVIWLMVRNLINYQIVYIQWMVDIQKMFQFMFYIEKRNEVNLSKPLDG